MRAQLLQEALVGVAVALQALQQQRAQPLFYLHGVSLAGIRGRCVAGYGGRKINFRPQRNPARRAPKYSADRPGALALQAGSRSSPKELSA
jgi:hypothetical protein